jgi:hypothetical protein
MDWNLFRKAVDQRPCAAIHMYYGGEPLLHPRIVDMVEYAERLGVCRVCTNGHLLTEAMAKAFVKMGLYELSFSLDAVESGVYQAVRGVGLSRVMENIHMMRRVRGSATLPRLLAEFIRFEGQPDQMTAAHEALAGQVDIIRDKRQLQYPLLTPDFVPSTRPCFQIDQFVAVLWDGRVTPCCLDLGAQCVVGDLNRQSMSEILDGPAMQSVYSLCRAGLQDRLVLCAHCVSADALNDGPYWGAQASPGTMA